MIISPRTVVIGRKVIRLDRTSSTNRYAGELALQQAPEGTVVLAAQQTAGRGRRGRSWHSARDKNMLLSVVLYPRFLPPRFYFSLTQMVALGIFLFCRQVVKTKSGRAAANHLHIKWPNDIMWKAKKLGGVLIETNISGKKMQHAVAGIGLNVNQTRFPEDLPNAISLKQITGQSLNRTQHLPALLQSLNDQYTQLADEAQRKQMAEDYKKYAR